MRAYGRAATLLVLLLAAAFQAQALDVSQGKIKLSLLEGTGRFSVSYLTAARSYVPLFSQQDPRTTMLSVVFGNRIFRMGDAAEFSETVERTPNGARFLWRSDFVTVTESLSFVASAGAPAADGIRMDLTLRNTAHDDTTAGVRFLIDTYLGETGRTPFTTDTGRVIKVETTLSGRSLPRYWVSPREGDAEQLGLQCMVTQEGITQPDRIVFANWKRLADAPWGYDTSSTRDFSLLPYSKNDSAVAQYYDPRPLPQGSQFTVTLVFGKYNPAGFTATSTLASDSAGLAQQGPGRPASARQGTAASPSSIRSDLGAVDSILSRVDAALAPGRTSARPIFRRWSPQSTT